MSQRPLLLLHGALGSSRQFELLKGEIHSDFAVHSLNFSGHGGEPLPPEPFSIEIFADDVLRWMSKERVDQVDVFGYSMGGYVGLFLAKHVPEKVNSVFTLGTKFQWTESVAKKEASMLDPLTIEQKVPAFAEQLASRHSREHWKQVVEKTAEMILNLGKNQALTTDDIKLIQQKAQIGVGDRDTLVTIEESMGVYRQLPHGRLLVLPSTSHHLEKIPVEQLAGELIKFFNQ